MFGDANVGNTGCPPMAPITRMNQLTPCLILLLKGKGGGGRKEDMDNACGHLIYYNKQVSSGMNS